MKLKKLCSRCGKSLKNKHLQPPVDTFPARFGRRQPKKMIGFEAETATDIRFNNVSFTVEEGPSLNIRQCKDIFLNDVRTKQPIAGQPVVDLEAIENLSIIHCDSTQIVRK